MTPAEWKAYWETLERDGEGRADIEPAERPGGERPGGGMNGYLLDANHASQLPRLADPLRASVFGAPAPVHVCPVVASEVRFGLDRKRMTAELAEWTRVLARLVAVRLDGVDAANAAVLRVRQERRGRTLHLPDALIAAVAVRRGLTLLTADRDFVGVPGLRTEDCGSP